MGDRHRLREPQGFGWLLAAVGPTLLTRFVREPTRPGILFSAYGLRGLVDLVLAATTWPLMAAAALLLYGPGTSTGTTTFTSLVQAHR
ncbi:hypothetical protein REH65_00035 [Saccharopolyspora sp. ID03-671]|uniref:hypothetical protein n=1 Tax=Saccharopolyspora sp. ID03-671 TaxID=3073066 RepID=UPI0032436E14